MGRLEGKVAFITGAARPTACARGPIRRGGRTSSPSSVGGLRGNASIGPYSAATFGLVGLMQVLALGLPPAGIRVNVGHPTDVDTTMIHDPSLHDPLLPDGDPATVTGEEAREAMSAMTALPRRRRPWLR